MPLELQLKTLDCAAFERVLAEVLHQHPLRVLPSCLMPNHWHFVLGPERDGELTAFLRWLTHTHAMRWHTHYHSGDTGHLDQGRFQSFPVATDEHLVTVLRYVERHPVRAQRVPQAEAWRWSSLGLRQAGAGQAELLLHPWPMPVPAHWPALVNAPQTVAELEAVRRAVRRGCPDGAPAGQEETARRLGLEASLRPRPPEEGGPFHSEALLI